MRLLILISVVLLSSVSFSQSPVNSWRMKRVLIMLSDLNFNEAKVSKKLDKIKKERVEDESFQWKIMYADFYSDSAKRLNRFWDKVIFDQGYVKLSTPRIQVEAISKFHKNLYNSFLVSEEWHEELSSKYGISENTLRNSQLFLDSLLYMVSDFDKDSVLNYLDTCVHVFGERKYNGCPDTDGDGIIDLQDSCVLDFGSRRFHGCPDRDGDGIIDKLDNCPDTYGLLAYQGCPELDKDEVSKIAVSLIDSSFTPGNFSRDSLSVNAYMFTYDGRLFLGYETYNNRVGTFKIGEYIEHGTFDFLSFSALVGSMKLRDNYSLIFGSILGEADGRSMRGGRTFDESTAFYEPLNEMIFVINPVTENVDSVFQLELSTGDIYDKNIELAALRALYGKTILQGQDYMGWIKFDKVKALANLRDNISADYRKISVLLIFENSELVKQNDFLIKFNQFGVENSFVGKPTLLEIEQTVERDNQLNEIKIFLSD